jgi:hypothetical protein
MVFIYLSFCILQLTIADVDVDVASDQEQAKASKQ